jgi:general secretion pathway protein K
MTHRSTPPPTRGGNAGFALIAVLWVMVGLSALALAGTLAARDAVSAATNRAELARAAWAAEDCLERARAAVSAALADARAEGPEAPTWRALDRAVGASRLVDGCDLAVVPAGRLVDLNTADGEQLRRLFRAAGAGPDRADSLADALLDWRDGDDQARPFGIEAAGYRAAGRPLPRNGPLADERELAEVRGFGHPDGVDTLLTVEPGRVFLDRAPPAVLASLPGMTPEAVARLQQLRGATRGSSPLAEVADGLSPPARDALLRAYQELATLTAPTPDAWIVTARARSGAPPVTAVVQVRLVRAGARAAVVRRRSWVE